MASDMEDVENHCSVSDSPSTQRGKSYRVPGVDQASNATQAPLKVISNNCEPNGITLSSAAKTCLQESSLLQSPDATNIPPTGQVSSNIEADHPVNQLAVGFDGAPRTGSGATNACVAHSTLDTRDEVGACLKQAQNKAESGCGGEAENSLLGASGPWSQSSRTSALTPFLKSLHLRNFAWPAENRNSSPCLSLLTDHPKLAFPCASPDQIRSIEDELLPNLTGTSVLDWDVSLSCASNLSTSVAADVGNGPQEAGSWVPSPHDHRPTGGSTLSSPCLDDDQLPNMTVNCQLDGSASSAPEPTDCIAADLQGHPTRAASCGHESVGPKERGDDFDTTPVVALHEKATESKNRTFTLQRDSVEESPPRLNSTREVPAQQSPVEEAGVEPNLTEAASGPLPGHTMDLSSVGLNSTVDVSQANTPQTQSRDNVTVDIIAESRSALTEPRRQTNAESGSAVYFTGPNSTYTEPKEQTYVKIDSTVDITETDVSHSENSNAQCSTSRKMIEQGLRCNATLDVSKQSSEHTESGQKMCADLERSPARFTEPDNEGEVRPVPTKDGMFPYSECHPSLNFDLSTHSSVFSLDDSMDMKTGFHVTSTPIVLTKALEREGQEKSAGIKKSLSVIVSMNSLSKEDISDVTHETPSEKALTAQKPRQGQSSSPHRLAQSSTSIASNNNTSLRRLGLGNRKIPPPSSIPTNRRVLLPPRLPTGVSVHLDLRPKAPPAGSAPEPPVPSSFAPPSTRRKTQPNNRANTTVTKDTTSATTLEASVAASVGGCDLTTVVSESKVPRSRLLHPKASGPPDAMTQRMSLRAPSRNPASAEPAVVPKPSKPSGLPGIKIRNLQPPSLGQKHSLSNKDILPLAKRVKPDPGASSTCARAPSIPKAAGVSRSLKKPVTALKTQPPKKHSSATKQIAETITTKAPASSEVESVSESTAPSVPAVSTHETTDAASSTMALHPGEGEAMGREEGGPNGQASGCVNCPYQQKYEECSQELQRCREELKRCCEELLRLKQEPQGKDGLDL